MSKLTVSITLDDGELLDQFKIVSETVDAITLSHVIKDVLSWKLEIEDDLSEPIDTDGDPAKGHRC